MSLEHKHRMRIRPSPRHNHHLIFFSCGKCGYLVWFTKDYFYNTIWKEGARNV